MSVSFSVVVAALCFFLNNVDESTALLCYQTQTAIGGTTVAQVQVSDTDYGCGVIYDRVCNSYNCEFITTFTTFQKNDAICTQNLTQPQCIWDAAQQLTKVSICCDYDECNQKITTSITPATCGSAPSTNTTTTPLTASGGFTTTTTMVAPAWGMNATESSNSSTTSTNMPSAEQAATTVRALMAPTTSSSERADGIQMIIFLGVAGAVLFGI